MESNHTPAKVKWYIRRGTKIIGPVSISQLRQAYGDGKFADTDEFRLSDRIKWIALKDIIARQKKNSKKPIYQVGWLVKSEQGSVLYLTNHELKEKASSGEVRKETLIRKDQKNEWFQASSILGLQFGYDALDSTQENSSVITGKKPTRPIESSIKTSDINAQNQISFSQYITNALVCISIFAPLLIPKTDISCSNGLTWIFAAFAVVYCSVLLFFLFAPSVFARRAALVGTLFMLVFGTTTTTYALSTAAELNNENSRVPNLFPQKVLTWIGSNYILLTRSENNDGASSINEYISKFLAAIACVGMIEEGLRGPDKTRLKLQGIER